MSQTAAQIRWREKNPEYFKQYHAEHRDEKNAYCREWHQTHREDQSRKKKEDRIQSPEKYRAYELKRRFGMTPEEYDVMFQAQGGVCAICGRPEPHQWRGKPRPLSVDHDHKTGVRRGLLCSDCNLMVGKSGDDAARLLAAAGYLTRWSGQPLIYSEPLKE